MYERLLRTYAQDRNRDMAHLRESLTAGDRREAQRLAHSLKGSSATLGAVAVQAYAAELEAAIKAGRSPEECKSSLAAVESTFATLAHAILAQPPEAVPSGTADPAGLHDAVERLATLLASGDIAARSVLQEYEALLRVTFGEAAERLAGQIDAFAYEQALETLRTLVWPAPPGESQ
jgi:two-component system sensor histidine kinase/response regulator